MFTQIGAYLSDFCAAEVEYCEEGDWCGPRVERVCGGRTSSKDKTKRGEGLAGPGSINETHD